MTKINGYNTIQGKSPKYKPMDRHAKKSSARGMALARKREALKEHENGEKYKL